MDSRHSDMQDKNSDNPKLRLRADLIIAMRSHHQRRRIRRRSLATAFLMICAGTVALLMLGRNYMPPAPPVASEIESSSSPTGLPQPFPVATESRHSIITIVRTDPDILERYVMRPSFKIETISDETLLASLASIGRPTGLIRYDGRVMLAKDVTDDLKVDDSP